MREFATIPHDQGHPPDLPPPDRPQLDDRRHQRLVLAARRGARHQDDGARADLEGRAGPDRRAPPEPEDHHRPHGHHGPLRRRRDRLLGHGDRRPARHPNIYVKVSALPGYSTQPFPNQNIAKYVREMVDKMGPQRCFWGTDLTRLMGHGLTYTDTIEQFTKHMDLTEEELEWIMGRGLCECSTGRSAGRRPDPDDRRPHRRGRGDLLDAFRMPRRRLRLLLAGLRVGAGLGGARSPAPRRRRRGPRYLDLTHETLAVGMATGYALVTRRGQAVLLHAGPACCRARARSTARCSAAPRWSSAPRSRVTYGEGDGADPGSQWYRNLSIVGGPHTLAAPFVKWANQAATPDVLYEMVLRAGEIATAPADRPGVSSTSRSRCCSPSGRRRTVRRPVAPAWRVTSARPMRSTRSAQALAAARRPVVITESAGRDPEAFAALVAFADALGVGVVEPQLGGLRQLPAHPSAAPRRPIRPPPASADLILLVNCRAPWYPPSADPFPNATTIVIDEVPQRPHVVYQVLNAAHLPRRRDRGDTRRPPSSGRRAPRPDRGRRRRRAELEAAHAARAATG